MTDFTVLLDEVRQRQEMVQQYLFDKDNRISFAYAHLDDAVYSYLKAGGKALRAAVLMFCCGAVGGDEKTAVPAAAAVELYHTFTLVHDDIIDRDELRRGVPTVHHDFTQRAKRELGMDEQTAQHYGLAIAILTGDLQQGWAASILPDLYYRYKVPAELALSLVQELFRRTQITLINGETVDIMQSQMPVNQLTEADVLTMLWQKTGILYEFSGRAGAAIGLRQTNLRAPDVEALAQFTGECGLAFQIQDDVLGIVGDEKQLGKPVGSDIREGKRTVIVLNSMTRMTSAQREYVLGILGNRDASEAQIQEVIDLLRSCGGVEYAKTLAREKVQKALSHLDPLPDTKYKELLQTWANYIIEREL